MEGKEEGKRKKGYGRIDSKMIHGRNDHKTIEQFELHASKLILSNDCLKPL